MKVIINEENAQETKDFITKRLTAIKNQRKSGELEDLALIIGKSAHNLRIRGLRADLDGKSLTFALEKDIAKTFLELAIMCKAVICC
jgi:phospholipid-transporting ATPase